MQERKKERKLISVILSVTRLTVGASQTGLSISETADLLEFAQADISTVYRE